MICNFFHAQNGKKEPLRQVNKNQRWSHSLKWIDADDSDSGESKSERCYRNHFFLFVQCPSLGAKFHQNLLANLSISNVYSKIFHGFFGFYQTPMNMLAGGDDEKMAEVKFI